TPATCAEACVNRDGRPARGTETLALLHRRWIAHARILDEEHGSLKEPCDLRSERRATPPCQSCRELACALEERRLRGRCTLACIVAPLGIRRERLVDVREHRIHRPLGRRAHLPP